MYDTRYVTARTKTIVDLCNGFHARHSALDERLDRVEVWELNRPFWNDVYPWICLPRSPCMWFQRRTYSKPPPHRLDQRLHHPSA